MTAPERDGLTEAERAQGKVLPAPRHGLWFSRAAVELIVAARVAAAEVRAERAERERDEAVQEFDTDAGADYWKRRHDALAATVADLRALATRENIAKVRIIGTRGQKRHPETKAMFEALADALAALDGPAPERAEDR